MNPGYQLLKLSCIVNKVELITLVTSPGLFYSRRMKDQLIKNFLNEIDDDEIILFLDGYDSIIVANEEEILSKYIQLNKGVAFSAEINCWPDNDLAKLFPYTNSTFKYLNSGGFIGRSKLIKNILNQEVEEKTNFINSDQYLWIKRFLKNQKTIGLDYNCKIFNTFYSDLDDELTTDRSLSDDHMRKKLVWFRNNYSFQGSRIYNKETEEYPCILHFNGVSKHLLFNEEIIKMIVSKIPGYEKCQSIYYEVNFDSVELIKINKY